MGKLHMLVSSETFGVYPPEVPAEQDQLRIRCIGCAQTAADSGETFKECCAAAMQILQVLHIALAHLSATP